jgi:hypothetical protein
LRDTECEFDISLTRHHSVHRHTTFGFSDKDVTMRFRLSRAISAAAGGGILAAATLIAPTAAHADSQDTTVTFSVPSGTLSIAVASGSVDLGAGAPSSTLTGSLGAVTVTDARAFLTSSWTASVTSTSFQTGGDTPPETVPASAVAYWSGPATATTGIGVFTPGQLTAALAAPIATPQAAFTVSLGVGNNTATWNPTIVVTVPPSAVTGTYSGIVTHSVL